MKLILFDIDGTLIDSGEAGSRSLNLAFRELFSIDNAFKGISMAGKTDTQIMKEGLSVHNIPDTNGMLPRVVNTYLKNLMVEINNDRKHIKTGVTDILDALSRGKNGYYLGLLTGNIEKGARIKLDPFALNSYFPFGAFGSDDEDRNKLLPVAVKRFEALYRGRIDYNNCIIVGDTPRDVYCSKPYGAACIAVATGPYPRESLLNAKADAVLDDMSDTDAFLNILYGL
ncbi:MAG: HAD family hydrolase [Thermodesulfovibrionales bacterium]|nr:HAD family hydrolase [Thermodesulfovibrionales bacterium]